MAKKILFKKYKKHESTLNWTDIDFWSEEVDIDIPALKEQIKHLIEVHPHVEDFLKMLRRQKKHLYLVTNAHYKVLDMKLKKTKLGKYFNAAITSFEVGHPKEELAFWKKLQKQIGFEKDRTLLIDDTEAVLQTARRFGIRYIVLKSVPSSKTGPEAITSDFPTIKDYSELMVLNSKL
jgi:putative hydrolase of the HAD superfamily